MLYRFITSGYTDALAYASALLSALWIFSYGQYNTALPVYFASVSPAYGVAVAAFFAALLICKYICLEGNLDIISILNAEKTRLEASLKNSDLRVVELKQDVITQAKEISALQQKIVSMNENSPDKQLTELRVKLRSSEEDKKAALSVLVKNLNERLHQMSEIHDSELLFAADVLRQEVGLLEQELTRGNFSYYELSIKIADIYGKLTELNDIHLVSSLDPSLKADTEAEIWLNFIKVNDNSEPAAVERSFKFFKFAFHPDRFTTDSLKIEATRYFQHSINAHNLVKKMGKAAP